MASKKTRVVVELKKKVGERFVIALVEVFVAGKKDRAGGLLWPSAHMRAEAIWGGAAYRPPFLKPSLRIDNASGDDPAIFVVLAQALLDAWNGNIQVEVVESVEIIGHEPKVIGKGLLREILRAHAATRRLAV